MHCLLLASLTLLLAVTSCGGSKNTNGSSSETCASLPSAGQMVTCGLPTYPGRDYELQLPAQPVTDAPILIVLHGGGGERKGALSGTCVDDDMTDPSCLHALASARGYVVVAPDGTENAFGFGRTWNAGGGNDPWRCVSGTACTKGVDDIAYFRALIADVAQRTSVDLTRVFVTGLSNGGAMSFRLACDLSENVVAVAPVSGAMQLTTNGKCEPKRPVGVFYTHGTDDPCWKYNGGAPDCPTGQRGKIHVSAQDTLDQWATFNGCQGSTTTPKWKDTVDDGMTTDRIDYTGCKAPTVHLRINGGGHTWPNGSSKVGARIVGETTRDWGNTAIMDFFDQF